MIIPNVFRGGSNSGLCSRSRSWSGSRSRYGSISNSWSGSKFMSFSVISLN